MLGIDGPEADEAVSHVGAGLRSQISGFHEKLGRQREDPVPCPPVFPRRWDTVFLDPFDDMNGVERTVGFDHCV